MKALAKKTLFLVIKILPALLLSGFLVGCDVPLGQTAAAGKATIIIMLTGSSSLDGGAAETTARTILPTPPSLASVVDSYEITLTSLDGFAERTVAASPASPSVTIADLEYGIWDISVAGKKDGVTTVTGSLKNQNIASGADVSLSIAMLPIQTATGTGKVSLAVSFPANCADSLSCRVEKADGTVAVAATAVALTAEAPNLKGTFSVDSLASANYTLVMTFSLAGQAVGIFREALNVWDGYTSDQWIDDSGHLVALRTFAASEFFDASASLSALAIYPSPKNYAFAVNTTSYDLGTTTQAAIRFTPTDAGVLDQTISYTWNGGTSVAAVSGQASALLTVSIGVNTLAVSVTAPNKLTTRVYSLRICGVGAESYASSSGIEMVKVAGGAFQRDSVAANISAVNSFLMGKFEVTKRQWRAIASTSYPAGTANSDMPITSITLFDALGFCNSLSMQEGLDPVYTISVGGVLWDKAFPVSTSATVLADFTKNGYRLPASLETAWAAMGGVSGFGAHASGVYTNGWKKEFAGDSDPESTGGAIGDFAWYSANAGDNGGSTNVGLHNVGTRLPNELGIYDLSGNASEWQWDKTDTSVVNGQVTANPFPSGSLLNYAGSIGSSQEHRAGSFQWGADSLALTYRCVYGAGSPGGDLGFRVARGDQAIHLFVGGMNNGVAGYWADGFWNELPPASGSTKAYRVWAIKKAGSDLYALGTWADSWYRYGVSWKNGVPTSLQRVPGGVWSYDFAIDAGIVYAAGNSDTGIGPLIPSTWIGSARTDGTSFGTDSYYSIIRSNSTSYLGGTIGGIAHVSVGGVASSIGGGTAVYSLAVSGSGASSTVVAAGTAGNTAAVYWRSTNNGATFAAAQMLWTGTANCQANKIVFDTDGNFHIAGSSGSQAMYSRNGGAPVALGGGVSATSVAVANGLVYICGTDVIWSKPNAGSGAKALLWIDGAPITLATGASNTSAADVCYAP